MKNSRRCVLGQRYGGWTDDAYYLQTQRLGIDSAEAEWMGFNIRHSTNELWSFLSECWLDIIHERRSA